MGKSSLTNALVGEKIAISFDKPQTTRNRIYGVVNRATPSSCCWTHRVCTSPRSRLGDYMVKVVPGGLSSVERALLLVEPIPMWASRSASCSNAFRRSTALRTVHQQDRHCGEEGVPAGGHRGIQ